MYELTEFLCRVLDMLYIPREVRQLKGHCLLHVSDTPSTFYSSLSHLIRVLSPRCIVHTGDLVDQVKLELHRRERGLYEYKLRGLIRVLEGHRHEADREIVLVLGNHDDPEIVRRLVRRCHVIEGDGVIRACGFLLDVSHYYSHLSDGEEKIHLYGHDTSYPSQGERKGLFLNGLLSINVISIPDGKVYTIPYPRYVDDHRLLKHKIGL